MASLEVFEPASPAISNATTASGQAARALPTVIRYPASGGASQQLHAPPDRAGGPFPLLVFSQGYDISTDAYSALLDAWARAGYVVAAPAYPFTDPSPPPGPDEADIVNHPADLRFLISTLLAQAQNRQSPLYHLLNDREIAVIGHSDGADVSLAVATNTCCKDAAVKAAVILSGAELSAFGGTYYRNGSVPLMVVQGDADTVNLPGCSVGLYDHAPPPKYYLDLLGATHEPPYLDPGPARNLVAAAVIDFLDYYLKDRRSSLLSLHGDASVQGTATITSAAVLTRTTRSCP